MCNQVIVVYGAVQQNFTLYTRHPPVGNEKLFSFSSRAYFHPLCSVCQHGRLQPRQTLVSMATRCRFFHHTAIFGLLHGKPDLSTWHFVPVSSFRERSLALPWQPAEHKEAWNPRAHVTYFHSRVLRRLNRVIFTVIQLELTQVQCDPLISI